MKGMAGIAPTARGGERVALEVMGLPESAPLTTLRVRVADAAQRFLEATGERLAIRVAPFARRGSIGRSADGEADTLTKRARRYVASEPLFDLDALVVPAGVRQALEQALHFERVRRLVFETWGVGRIEPFPRTALNLHGPSGNGKTLAAHGLARAMGRRILCVSYADIESMYHGEGPKNVQAIFHAAAAANAVLFVDEADSLLSKRLTNVMQGSEQAINSMRSQILICLDRFPGTVIFATNLMANYDGAFLTRIRHLHFPSPDAAARVEILKRHLPEPLPLGPDVNLGVLSALAEGFSGREIKDMVVQAAVAAAVSGSQAVGLIDFDLAARAIRAGRSEAVDGRGQLEGISASAAIA